MNSMVFSARCNIYISRICYDVSVCLSVRLSVTEVHWPITANLGFKFRSQFSAHCGRGACGREQGPDHRRRVEGSSRAMLATARPSCSYCVITTPLSGTVRLGAWVGIATINLCTKFEISTFL